MEPQESVIGFQMRYAREMVWRAMAKLGAPEPAEAVVARFLAERDRRLRAMG